MISRVISCFVAVTLCAPVFSSDWLAYREVAISNAEAIRQFDVLLVMEQFSSHENKSLKRRTRLVLDFDLNQCFCFDVQEMEDTTIPSEPKVMVLSRLAVFNGRVGTYRQFPGGGLPEQINDLFEWLGGVMRIPDLRCVGLGRFPETFSCRGQALGFEQNLKNRARIPVANVERYETVLQNRNHTRIVFASDKVEARYDFDGKTSMPTVISTSVGAIDQRLLYDEQVFHWKEIDGLYLPIAISTNAIKQRDNLGVPVKEEFKTAEAHWFSINQPLNKKLLDHADEPSLPKLMKLVDPASSGADSLLK